MTLRNSKYKDRLLDKRLEMHLRAFGAVEIVGAMWCGKTWMAEAHAESKINLSIASARSIVEADHSLAFEGGRPHVIDEWQEVPSLWDETRLAVDAAAGARGLYILTGSSTPKKEETVHSGTGRISRIHLRPMSLSETGDSDCSVSLSGLFEGVFQKARVQTSLRAIAGMICKGGWPGALHIGSEDAELIPNQYLDTLISSISRKSGKSGKSGENEYRIRRFVSSMARNVGQAVTYQTIANDMAEGDLGSKNELVSRQHIEAIICAFKDRFIIEDLCGWDAPIRSKSRVRVKPKRGFVDPSLTAASLGADKNRLLSDGQLLGKLFEELCLRDLRIYASCMDSALPDSVKYYRDSDNLEVDAIIELRDGRWAAIEIKLSENKVAEGIANLMRFKKKVASNPLARNPEPSFMAVLVGKTDFCRRTPEGVYVVPCTSLTA
jgi:predicted AAA+ superfamily ATPase